MAAVSQSCLDWALAFSARAGETESGDLHVVEAFSGGILVAVLDGLGHGPAAAEAAQAAAKILKRQAGASLIPLLMECHNGLRHTRGVVMSLASFNQADCTMTWIGVGNVEGLFFHLGKEGKIISEPLLPSRGVVGSRLPPLRATVLPVARGDTLIFVTDGIRSGFEENLILSDSPQHIADRILARDGMGTDDSMVLVARYEGNKA
jgi:phosphoserine phosphatase RsbX